MFEGFPSHWSALKSLIWLYKGVMKAARWTWKTVTGSLIHVTDALAGDVSALSVAINPVQSLNGYDNPWPAGGHYNQWDEDWELGGINDSTGEKTPVTTQIRSVNYIPCQSATSYYVACANTSISIYIYFYNSAHEFLSRASAGGYYNVARQTITTPSGAAYMMMKAGTLTTYGNDIAINYPSTVHTYSPYSNICPISGWSEAKVTRMGKNLFDPTSTSTEWVGGNASIYEVPEAKTMRIPVLPGQPLTISNANASSGTNILLIAYFDASGTMLARDVAYSGDKYKTATAPANTAYAIVGFYTWSESSQQQLEFGSTATAYEPYSGTTLTIDLDGTRYGGTLDVLTGVLTVDRASKPMNEMIWVYDATNTRFYSTSIVGQIKKGTSGWLTDLLCSAYSPANGVSQNGTISEHASTGYIYCKDTAYTDATLFSISLVGQTLVYPLATPQTVQLDPAQLSTLAGENNVWADTGDVTVTYMAQGG